MENRKANMIFGKAGGNASPNSYTCKLSVPKAWVDRMGLNPESREVELSFDGDRITVERLPHSSIKHVPLASNKRIHTFAMIWMQMYKNHALTPFSFFEDSQFVGEGLSDLGFEMDCGESINRLLPGLNISEVDTFKRVINQITDIQVLGNAIFSQWRYWNHWSFAPMEEKDYEWFVLAFFRLAELTT